jgi:alkyl hydroperoxide reductase subunit AhpF
LDGVVALEFGSVAWMRIAGVRLGAPVARLLSEILEGGGYPETARKIADAIERQITIEAPLTLEDYEAISTVLAHNCPAPLYRLRTELLEELRRLRRITGG